MKRISMIVFACLLAASQLPVAYATPATTKPPAPLPSFEPTWLLNTDARVARVMNAYRRDGYFETYRLYSRLTYDEVPTQNYIDGEYEITVTKTPKNLIRPMYYAVVHVEVIADINARNHQVGRVWSEDLVKR